MTSMRPIRQGLRFRAARVLSVLIVLGVAAAMPARLPAFPLELGVFKGSLDTTLSAGVSYRLSDPDRSYFGTSAGGLQNSVNADDGNLNYLQGVSSLAVKGTSELQLESGPWRVFVRGTGFYDFENEGQDRARTPLSNAALEKVGSDLRLLDYFIAGSFNPADHPLDVRVGSQVLSWGESTFLQNGINVINPLDVARIRTPGAELKEALMPVPMISWSYGVTDNLTVEGFYQFSYQETEIDPPGTYFSSNDFAGEGGQRVYLGFGAVADTAPYGFVPRGPKQDPDDAGQFGLAARLLVPQFNDTEFGFYYINYHSRLPLISAITPTRGVSTQEVVSTASTIAQATLAPVMIANGVPPAAVGPSLTVLIGAALTGVPVGNLPPSLQPYYPAAQTIASTSRTLGFFSAAATARYLIEHPEDIHLYGVSFNTDLGSTGISLQGEVSYKVGTALQIDDVELLFAAMSTLSPAFGPPNNQIGNYLGQYNTPIRGWKTKDVWQAQVTGTKVLGPTLGASQMVMVGEVGITHVPHLPEQSTLRFDGSGTFTSGSASAMLLTGNGAFPATPASMFADPTSWGYQLAARLDYNDVFGGVNMSPSLAFGQDVSGNTPLPLGNFIEGRTSLTMAVEFTYLNRWAWELRYVNYSGGGLANLIADRDFVTATMKYSF
jgi:Protein of unknown function (DUF1302)